MRLETHGTTIIFRAILSFMELYKPSSNTLLLDIDNNMPRRES